MKKSRWFILASLTAVLAVLAATTTAGAARVPASVGSAAAASCKTPTIGLAAPITGPAAPLGVTQRNWFKFTVANWNKTHTTKIKTVEGDTKLPDVNEATKVAQQFASNSSILAVVGPAGSQENEASTAAFKRGGLAWVSGSATRVSLTDGSRAGYFFRTVPNDDAQGKSVAKFILAKLAKSGDTVVIVDDKESYGLGLSDGVQKILEAAGVKVRARVDRSRPVEEPGLRIACDEGAGQCEGRVHPVAARHISADVRSGAEGAGQERSALRLGRPLRPDEPHDQRHVRLVLGSRQGQEDSGRVREEVRRPAVLRCSDRHCRHGCGSRHRAGLQGRERHSRRGQGGDRQDLRRRVEVPVGKCRPLQAKRRSRAQNFYVYKIIGGSYIQVA